MKYNQPFDQPGNPDAAYTDGNPSTGQNGSIPPAASIEYPQRELTNFMTDSGLTPTNSDLHQVSRGVQTGAVTYGVDTGTANAMVVLLNPVPQAYYPGMTIRVKKIASDNTGAMTINVGLGIDNITRATGAALGASDMPANTIAELCWDGSQWQYINVSGATSGSVTNNYASTTVPYCVDTSVVANTITAPFATTITHLAAGDMIKIKLANSVTGPSIVNVNAMASITLVRPDGSPIRLGDAFIGQILVLEFDGTNLQIVNMAATAAYVRGHIYLWPTDTAPTGTLECDGSAVSRVTYAALFSIISSMYGPGNGTTTFNLPDYRGAFPRGWNHGRGLDPSASSRTNRGDGTIGDHVGTWEAQAVALTDVPITINNPYANWAAGRIQSVNSRGPFPAGGVPITIDGGATYPVQAGSGAPGNSSNIVAETVWASMIDTYLGGESNTWGAPYATFTGYAGEMSAVLAASISGTVTLSAGAETRPVNISTMYVIAY